MDNCLLYLDWSVWYNSIISVIFFPQDCILLLRKALCYLTSSRELTFQLVILMLVILLHYLPARSSSSITLWIWWKFSTFTMNLVNLGFVRLLWRTMFSYTASFASLLPLWSKACNVAVLKKSGASTFKYMLGQIGDSCSLSNHGQLAKRWRQWRSEGRIKLAA